MSEPTIPPPEEPAAGMPNIALPTFGAKQFWADVLVYAGWRIQENALTGHHRLLDPGDVRRAWGSLEACRAALDAARESEGFRPTSRRLAILLHGLFRSRASMEKLAGAMQEAGYEPVAVTYSSSRRSLAEHAERLERLLGSIEDADEVSFVTHSLGALVVRQALARKGPWMDRLRVHRLAMLAPPNRGSALADRLKGFPPFEWIAGPSGLAATSEEVEKLPAPSCRFAVIAGGRGDGKGWNPLVPGDDDGVVGVEETRIDGAEDFLVVNAFHTVIMDHAEVIEAVIRYLRTGKLREN